MVPYLRVHFNYSMSLGTWEVEYKFPLEDQFEVFLVGAAAVQTCLESTKFLET